MYFTLKTVLSSSELSHLVTWQMMTVYTEIELSIEVRLDCQTEEAVV